MFNASLAIGANSEAMYKPWVFLRCIVEGQGITGKAWQAASGLLLCMDNMHVKAEFARWKAGEARAQELHNTRQQDAGRSVQGEWRTIPLKDTREGFY